MDEKKLERALAGLPLGPIRYFDQIGSTNDEAARWAANEAPDLSLVVADEQTAGRGRMQRRWFTPAGSALAFSLILRPGPSLIPEYTSLLHLAAAAGLAVRDGILITGRSLAGSPLSAAVEIKWPNDVLINRRKTAGVLAEAHWQGDRLLAIVLGIGINVSPASVPPAGDLVYPATCVETALGIEVDRTALLRSVLESFIQWRLHLGKPSLLQAWEERLAFRGENVKVLDGVRPESTVLHEGTLLGLGPDGSLLLKDAFGKILTLNTGEIRLRPAETLPELPGREVE